MIVSVFISLLALVVVLNLLFCLVKTQNFEANYTQELPKISVVIAVRNEEHNLIKLFESIRLLDYPIAKIEILFGDDQSEDSSFEMISRFCAENENTSVYKILPTTIQIAKGNVLMQLIKHATGEYLYFMDADMEPNPSILREYASRLKADMAGIVGVTLPQGKGLFYTWQKIDWVIALSMASKAQALGYHTTGMGNNMLVNKSDYLKIGGYEALPKSVIEDFTLYNALIKTKKSFPLVFEKSLLSITHPINSIKSLFQQRKRWMTGGIQVHWFLKLVLGLQGLYYPLCYISMFYVSIWILILIGSKLVLQSIFVYLNFKRLDQKISLFDLISYELYNSLFTPMLIVYYLLPFKFDWKKREYGNN